MSTALLCESCGKRCGTARRGDDDAGLAHDDVVLDARFDLNEKPPHKPAWRDSSGDTALKIYSLTKHIDAWPMIWECEHCRRQVMLDLDRAYRVGRARRLVVPAGGRIPTDS